MNKNKIQSAPVAKFDFCRLPYPDDTMDVVVFDPPYVKKHSASSDLQSYSAKINKRYGLTAGTESYADIVENYEDGMAEGKRVLRRGGLLLVKCANFFDSTQRWLNEDVFQIANQLGLYKRDEFDLESGRFLISCGRSSFWNQLRIESRNDPSAFNYQRKEHQEVTNEQQRKDRRNGNYEANSRLDAFSQCSNRIRYSHHCS